MSQSTNRIVFNALALTIGTSVLVAFNPSSNWSSLADGTDSNSWVGSMNHLVGRMGEVIEIQANALRARVRIPGEVHTWWFPAVCLQRVAENVTSKSVPSEPVLVELNDDYSAEVSVDGVEIDGDTFPFRVFDALKEKHDEVMATPGRKVREKRPLLQYNDEGLPDYNMHAFERLQLGLGDSVLVQSKIEDSILTGQLGSVTEVEWQDEMNELVGKTLIVTDLDTMDGTVELDNGYWFPALSLVLEERELKYEDKTDLPSIELGHSWTGYVSKKQIFVGCQTFKSEKLAEIMEAIAKFRK